MAWNDTTLPDQTGHANEVLTTNGTIADWAANTDSRLPDSTAQGQIIIGSATAPGYAIAPNMTYDTSTYTCQVGNIGIGGVSRYISTEASQTLLLQTYNTPYAADLNVLSFDTGVHSNVAGIHTSLNLSPRFSQTGTAGFNVLHINSDITTQGSGDKYLIIAKNTNIVKFSVDSSGLIKSCGLYIASDSASLADDATIAICTSKAGWGRVSIGDDQEFADFRFSTTAVTLISSSTNVSNADTDLNLCVYVSTNILTIKNRLGSTLTCRYKIEYS